jgi:DNA polymerase III subunit beta
MEFNIPVQELAKGLQRVQGIIEKKTTMPILANVLLTASKDGHLTVSATNLELGLTGKYPCEVITPGAITLSGKSLFEIVRALPKNSAKIKTTNNDWVEISCGKVNYRVVGMAADGYPTLPSFSDVEYFKLGRDALKAMIDKTLYSVCTDETRYNLTGVFCEALTDGDGIRMVSTDGHRLSIIEQPTDDQPLIKKGIIIPRKGMIEIRRLLDDGDSNGQLGFKDNSAIFQKDGLTLTMQLIEGEFPDYKQVIPSSCTKKIVINRAILQAALKRTSLLSPDKAQGVRLDLSPGNLSLSAHNPDIGEAKEDIEINYDGEELKIGFNYRYISDVLHALTDLEVELQLSDSLSPGVIIGAGSAHYRAIIMPMRL